MRRLNRRERGLGQGLVEFALVLPVFLVILIGMFDLGHAIWANNAAANAAREAARFAAVHGGNCEDLAGSCSSTSYCPVGPAPVSAAIPSSSTYCPYPSPSKQSIYDVATNYLIGGGTSTTVTACYYSTVACSGNVDQTTTGTNLRGNAVTVYVSTEVPLVLGAFFGMSTMTVSATSTMLINH
jgi:TadE-like protein